MPRWLALFVACAPSALPQSGPLPARETLTYNIEWRLVTAGKAILQWSAVSQRDDPGWQANLHLESVGLVSKLFKVEDDYTVSYRQPLCAQSSLLTSHEGNRRRETRVTFDGETRKASYQERDLVKNTTVASQEIDIPECVHDVLGGLYALRTLNLEPGQSAEIPVSDGKKSVMAKVEAMSREDVKVPDGAYKTIRYEILLFNNVLYRRPARLYVWLSDDRRKLPVQVRVRMQFTIGTVTMQLEKHE
ncbi:MAG: hypothetical protein C5B51_30325 [Terriglobia bacterium]|nr:MAG: hypothetical protein C5B51_30325 [Terriglobia bacterium]